MKIGWHLSRFAERRKVDVALVLLGFIWAVLMAWTIQLRPEFSSVGDDWSYLQAAKKLYFEGLPDEGRPFGIAAIYGLPLLFGGSIEAAVRWGLFVNLCCWLLSSVLVYRILLPRYSRNRAFRYALLAMSCAGSTAIAFRFLPEPILILLLLFAMLSVSRFELSRKPRYLSFALAAMLFAVMIKPVALAIAVIVAGYYFRSLPAVVKHRSSAWIYAMLLLIAVQMNEMHKAYGDYKISYIGNITYYNYLGAKADCYRKNIEFIPGENKRAKHFQSFSSHGQQQLVRDDLTEQLRHNMFNLARAYLFCLYNNSSKGSYIIASAQNADNTMVFKPAQFFFKALSKLQNILLTAVGIVLSFYFWRRWKTASGFAKILAAVTLYIFFVSGMSCFQADRFHLVFFPLVIMMIAEYRANKKAGAKPA